MAAWEAQASTQAREENARSDANRPQVPFAASGAQVHAEASFIHSCNERAT
jgi:hypothetical protein